MNPAINDIIGYLNDQTLTEEMEPFAIEIGPVEFRGALEILVNWLQLQLRLKHEKPYPLNGQKSHDANLRQLLISWKDLSDIFEIQDNALDFKSSISKEDRLEIRKHIRDLLRPYFFVSTRNP